MEVIREYLIELKSDLKNKKGYRHIPNLLTLIRFVSPFFIIPLMLFEKYVVALMFVVIAALTDLIDGKIARKYNCTSEMGRLMDAVIDKFFAVSLLIPVLKINIIFIIILVIEVLIALTNLLAQKHNKKPKTLYIGKVKTAFQSVFLSICYLSFVLNIENIIIYILFGIVIVLEIFTLFTYIIKNTKN